MTSSETKPESVLEEGRLWKRNESMNKPSFFPPTPTKLRLCTANVCTNGHEWIPTITLAKCGYGTPQGWNGCGAPVLMVKLESCPICNEPVKEMRFRTDHTPPIPFVSPLCIKGSVSQGEASEVVLTRDFPKIEKEYEEKFPPIGEPPPVVQEFTPTKES